MSIATDLTYRAVIFAVTRIGLELGCHFLGGSRLCSSESVATSSFLRASEVAFVADDMGGITTGARKLLLDDGRCDDLLTPVAGRLVSELDSVDSEGRVVAL